MKWTWITTIDWFDIVSHVLFVSLRFLCFVATVVTSASFFSFRFSPFFNCHRVSGVISTGRCFWRKLHCIEMLPHEWWPRRTTTKQPFKLKSTKDTTKRQSIARLRRRKEALMQKLFRCFPRPLCLFCRCLHVGAHTLPLTDENIIASFLPLLSFHFGQPAKNKKYFQFCVVLFCLHSFLWRTKKVCLHYTAPLHTLSQRNGKENK